MNESQTPIADKLRIMLDEQEFYEHMQHYRHAPLAPMNIVVEKFEAVKSYLVGFIAFTEKEVNEKRLGPSDTTTTTDSPEG